MPNAKPLIYLQPIKRPEKHKCLDPFWLWVFLIWYAVMMAEHLFQANNRETIYYNKFISGIRIVLEPGSAR